MFIAHGQGPIAKQVGRIVVDVAPDGTQTTLFQAGRWDGDLNGPILRLPGLTEDRSGAVMPSIGWRHDCSRDRRSRLHRRARRAPAP